MSNPLCSPLCPDCKSPYIDRVRRTGIVETIFLPLLGFYPWRCEDCVNLFLCRTRRKPRVDSRATSCVPSLFN